MYQQQPVVYVVVKSFSGFVPRKWPCKANLVLLPSNEGQHMPLRGGKDLVPDHGWAIPCMDIPNSSIFIALKIDQNQEQEIARVVIPLSWIPVDKVVETSFPMKTTYPNAPPIYVFLKIHIKVAATKAFGVPPAPMYVMPQFPSFEEAMSMYNPQGQLIRPQGGAPNQFQTGTPMNQPGPQNNAPPMMQQSQPMQQQGPPPSNMQTPTHPQGMAPPIQQQGPNQPMMYPGQVQSNRGYQGYPPNQNQQNIPGVPLGMTTPVAPPMSQMRNNDVHEYPTIDEPREHIPEPPKPVIPIPAAVPQNTHQPIVASNAAEACTPGPTPSVYHSPAQVQAPIPLPPGQYPPGTYIIFVPYVAGQDPLQFAPPGSQIVQIPQKPQEAPAKEQPKVTSKPENEQTQPQKPEIAHDYSSEFDPDSDLGHYSEDIAPPKPVPNLPPPALKPSNAPVSKAPSNPHELVDSYFYQESIHQNENNNQMHPSDSSNDQDSQYGSFNLQ